MPVSKTDFKKTLKHLYQPGKTPAVVDVPEMQFIAIEGKGPPENEAFKEAIEALYQISYTIKFYCKKNNGKDYVVMPLEGLWWADDINDFLLGAREQWQWKLMIMQPDFVSRDIYEESFSGVSKKKCNAAVSRLEFISFTEGKSVQMMHVGPFSEEHSNIMKLHETIHALGASFNGQIYKHHEIYLSDFMRTNPANLKTILRQPFTIQV